MNAFQRYRLRLTDASGGESTLAVIIAFCANVLVAVAKTVAAFFTRSASMAAEAVHSWVDAGNSILILVAERTARRPADEEHPLGFGRASYVWSLFASLGMFALGAVATFWHGVTELRHGDEAAQSYLVGYLVIAASFVFEGFSFVQVYRQIRDKAERRGREVLEHALMTSDSPLRAVFAEDSVALVALVIAAAAMALHQLTGRAIYDAIGAMVIGVLLGAAALFLLWRNRQFLEGKALTREQRAAAIRMLRGFPEIDRVTFVYAEVIGPERLLMAAGVSLVGEHRQTDLAYRLRDLEKRIRARQELIGMVVLTLATPDEEEAQP